MSPNQVSSCIHCIAVRSFIYLLVANDASGLQWNLGSDRRSTSEPHGQYLSIRFYPLSSAQLRLSTLMDLILEMAAFVAACLPLFNDFAYLVRDLPYKGNFEIGWDEIISMVSKSSHYLFSLWHEHQRPDRNHYVRFNCGAVKGYDAAKVKVEQAGQHSMEQVCTNGAIAALYGWNDIKDFDTINRLDPASNLVGQN
jgi:hypothetical protein